MHSPSLSDKTFSSGFSGLKWVQHDVLFYFMLFFNLFLLCITRFYPSLDGPAHLYNSNLLLHLLTGDQELATILTVNTLPVPNWVSHFILALFNSLLPGWMAEKIFLMGYVTGMAFSFRYLVLQLNPNAGYSSILIFPFIYSFLFHLGFYNFCLSFIIFFYTLGYWFKHHHSMQTRHYLVMAFLITATYFTNILVCALTGFLLGLHILSLGYEWYERHKTLKNALVNTIKKLLLLLAISMPALILVVLFVTQTDFAGNDQRYSISELIKWLNDARPFIVYNYTGEEVFTEQYFHGLLILAIVGFFISKPDTKPLRPFVQEGNLFLILLTVVLVFYFLIPDGSEAGMMSDRFALIIYMLMLIWVVSQLKPSFLGNLVILVMLVVHVGLQFRHLNGSLRKLSQDASLIYDAADVIKPGSVVYPVNLSDNWLELHFSNYLGADKPMIILENYEANVGWFPIKWNETKVTPMTTDDLPGLKLNGNREVMIDYLVFYGNKQEISSYIRYIEQNGISKHYKQVFENSLVLVFEKTNK